jgi:hypothetical protein
MQAPLDQMDTLLHDIEKDFCKYSPDALPHSDDRIKQQFNKLCLAVQEFREVIKLLRKGK